MADGKTHFYANLALGCALTGTTWLVQPDYVVPVAIGSIMGTLVTPDFDLEGKSITESALYVIPPLAWLWQQLWFGYALLFRHRGFSHNVLLGTLGRVLWSLLIVTVCSVFFFGVAQLVGWHFDPLTIIKSAAIIILNPALLGAWFLMDCMHYLLDASWLRVHNDRKDKE